MRKDFIYLILNCTWYGISGMKILRPRRTEQRCCLKYLVYKTIFFLLLLGLQPNPQILQNVAISNNTMNKIEEKRGNRYHIRAYGTDQSPID